MPAGRKSKYTPECVAKIVQAVKLGSTYELAASYAGIDRATFFRWMNEKRDFHDQVKDAEGAGAVGWLGKIELAANDGNWQAAAWKLERRYPHEYGRRVQELHGSVAITDERVDLSKLTDEELREYRNLTAKASNTR